ncbi:hypothetical protein HacjB3_13750 [Halalkalicoccus jeotgali B3]|uniref:Uncharacterized protein n=1 Tax=Halalkalicoccus jeotgali (strain DSM 18796 / CECT 7217 / JCM 14584 / KCTC 4019 / B3) TaxID=795797 RepID=D8J7W1_HALJB|nr:hypothetical protein HacjB3_13750 [Halalkalicoccus jeotgali B3]
MTFSCSGDGVRLAEVAVIGPGGEFGSGHTSQ